MVRRLWGDGDRLATHSELLLARRIEGSVRKPHRRAHQRARRDMATRRVAYGGRGATSTTWSTRIRSGPSSAHPQAPRNRFARTDCPMLQTTQRGP